MSYIPRLKRRFKEEIIPYFLEKVGLRNVMEVPRLVKITLNMGVGDAIQNMKSLDNAVEELTAIAGQKAVITRAKKSIAGFKLRAGMPIGCKVTLRGNMMYDFFDKLVNIALPRVRDFRGVSTSGFDGKGNFTIGVREQIIFPEINYDKVEKIRGLSISITTTAKNDEIGRILLEKLGMPFRK